MNDFGNFLYELRKEKGMTQTELAGKLGVTNKAVSKWETGEAMPETGLLMPLSEIFGVSIDELLSGKRERTRGERDGNVYTACACGIIMLSCIIVYMHIGAFTGLWHPFWLIVVVASLACGVIGAVGEAFVHGKNNLDK